MKDKTLVSRIEKNTTPFPQDFPLDVRIIEHEKLPDINEIPREKLLHIGTFTSAAQLAFVVQKCKKERIQTRIENNSKDVDVYIHPADKNAIRAIMIMSSQVVSLIE